MRAVDTPCSVLVSGASGLIGSALLRRLQQDAGYRPLAGVRRLQPELQCEQRLLGELDGRPLDPALLSGVEVLVHCAARVHVMRETAADALAAFRAINVQGSLALARAAAAAGVRRFIFLSSIKAQGEQSAPGAPLRADGPLQPQDAYGQSKAEAEQALAALCRETGMQLVIIRPVLVYGPGAKGNFASLLRWLARGVPLPLGAVHNRRSLLALDNLVDLLRVCLQHPAAAGQCFLASDGEDLSTSELLRRAAHALGRPARLLPVPAGLLQCGARLLGQPGIAQRLCGSLQVDITPTCQQLDWRPPQSVDAALLAAATGFRQQQEMR